MEENIEYVKIFYCVMYDEKCIEYVSSKNPRKFDKLEIYDLLSDVAREKDSFIGFIDSEENTIQFYVNKYNEITLDIPVIEKTGSYTKNIDNEIMYEIIKNLKEPYKKYIEELKLDFHVW